MRICVESLLSYDFMVSMILVLVKVMYIDLTGRSLNAMQLFELERYYTDMC